MEVQMLVTFFKKKWSNLKLFDPSENESCIRFGTELGSINQTSQPNLKLIWQWWLVNTLRTN